MAQPERFEIDPRAGSIRRGGRMLGMNEVRWAIPTCGAVYGVLGNYGAPPDENGAASASPMPLRAPALFVKPANTWIAYGDAIPLPDDVESVEVGASLGVVMGKAARRIRASDALDYVAGYTIVNDICEPHDEHDRAAVRVRCRDGFCAIGPWIVPASGLPSPQSLTLRVFVNDVLEAETRTADMIRSVPTLIADVSEFVTLREGDLMHTGMPANAPRMRPGDRVKIELDGIGWLENRVVAEREILSGGSH